MQASVHFQVKHHYNQEYTGIAFTRILKEVPNQFRTFDRLWTIHILHEHEAPGEISNQSTWCNYPFECRSNASTAEKIQNCISTLFAIDSSGINGAELRRELLVKEPFARGFHLADSWIAKEAHREIPMDFYEEEKIRKAAEGALKGAIELEKIIFENSLGA